MEELGNELSMEQTWEVLTFAQSLAGVNQTFSPYILNEKLRSLNNDPLIPTEDKIRKALLDAKNSGKELIGYSQTFENIDMLYKRTIKYYSTMLAFDLSMFCTNIERKSEYRSKEYKEDKKRVFEFLDRFDVKAELHRMTEQVLRNEVYFVWLRMDSPKGYTLQTLPQDRCLITGLFNKQIPLFDFDMSYFLQAGVDIDAYGEAFKEYYNETFSKNGNYDPMNTLMNRDGSFGTMHQTSPEDGAWCFKMDLGNFNTVPFLAPMMLDITNNKLIRELQRDKDMISAYAMLFGEMKMLDSTKELKKNQFAVDPARLGQLLSLVQSALKSNIKVNALPAEHVDLYQYQDHNPKMYSNQISNSASIGSSGSRIIYSSDKMSQEELRSAITNDGNLMKALYAQFENFLEFYINKATKKYKFRFKLDGINYEFDREARIGNLKDYADRGWVLGESVWASALGMSPQDFSRSLEEASGSDLMDKLNLLPSIHTQSGAGDSKGGRPRKTRETLSTQSREYD